MANSSRVRDDSLDERVDIRDVSVNKELPPGERLADYIKQIKDPYHVKYKNISINIRFADTDATLTDRMIEYIHTF